MSESNFGRDCLSLGRGRGRGRGRSESIASIAGKSFSALFAFAFGLGLGLIDFALDFVVHFSIGIGSSSEVSSIKSQNTGFFATCLLCRVFVLSAMLSVSIWSLRTPKAMEVKSEMDDTAFGRDCWLGACADKG